MNTAADAGLTAQEYVVKEILCDRYVYEGRGRNKKQVRQFMVLWDLGDTTWEPEDNMEDTEALEKYLKRP